MIRKAFYILLVALLGLAACDVHELPESGLGIDLSIALDFPGGMTDYTTINYTKAGAPPVPRYTVQIYRYDADGNLEKDPVWNEQFTGDRIERLDTTLNVSLSQSRFLAFAWVDYTVGGEAFYNPSSMPSIYLSDGYKGCEDAKDAFYGVLDFDLSTIRPTESVIIEEVITMRRPLAKIQFFIADQNDFLAGAGAGGTEGWKIYFSYPGFLPDAYDLTEGKTVDARQGANFEGRLELTPEGICLGYDYVFVNGTESSVTMAMTVTDASGQVIGSFPATNIPVAAGKRTLVKGDYFSGTGQGGVGIRTDFDGEINIAI